MKFDDIINEVMVTRERRGSIISTATGVVNFPVLDYLRLTATDDMMAAIDGRARPLQQYKDFYNSNLTGVHQFIDVKRDSGQVVGHEGRHRAWAIFKEHGMDATMKVHIRFFSRSSLYD